MTALGKFPVVWQTGRNEQINEKTTQGSNGHSELQIISRPPAFNRVV